VSVVAGSAVDDYRGLATGRRLAASAVTYCWWSHDDASANRYIVNTTYDNLYTRIIVDQVFIDVRDYILDQNFLRAGNTAAVRARIKSGIEALLNERNSWISCDSA
jgi:hypothetical protein